MVGACVGSAIKGTPDEHVASEHTSHTLSSVYSTATTAPPNASQAVAAVRTYWSTYLRLAGRTSSFDQTVTRGAVAKITTAAALDRLLSVLRTNAVAGYVVKGTIESTPRLVSLVGSTATVRDCYDDRSGLFAAADGTRIDQDDPNRHLALFGLERQVDGWKVSTIDQPEEPCRSP